MHNFVTVIFCFSVTLLYIGAFTGMLYLCEMFLPNKPIKKYLEIVHMHNITVELMPFINLLS